MVNTVVSPAASGGEREKQGKPPKLQTVPGGILLGSSQLRDSVGQMLVFPDWKTTGQDCKQAAASTLNEAQPQQVNHEISVTPLRHRDEAHRRSSPLMLCVNLTGVLSSAAQSANTC